MPIATCDRCNKKAKWLLEDYESFDGGELQFEEHKEEEIDNEYAGELLEFVNSLLWGMRIHGAVYRSL